ncbi:hypothetical protein PHLCEN_2v204 [Hermanssonia centrifuga]|uniref:Uncharacterized protein n=1 Tax=Hermanssonia centrifuga TaxID=98765 RepID=A0A2R6S6N8_9APHY|nr:hypothetical protein PHLCEN_2v204 [Hermanssonia centrifuga]
MRRLPRYETIPKDIQKGLTAEVRLVNERRKLDMTHLIQADARQDAILAKSREDIFEAGNNFVEWLHPLIGVTIVLKREDDLVQRTARGQSQQQIFHAFNITSSVINMLLRFFLRRQKGLSA